MIYILFILLFVFLIFKNISRLAIQSFANAIQGAEPHAAYLFRKIGTLFRNINKDYSPFIPENVKLIKIIAVFVAVIVLLETGIIPAILIGLMLWAVALLFDYGCELQNESDEIL